MECLASNPSLLVLMHIHVVHGIFVIMEREGGGGEGEGEGGRGRRPIQRIEKIERCCYTSAS